MFAGEMVRNVDWEPLGYLFEIDGSCTHRTRDVEHLFCTPLNGARRERGGAVCTEPYPLTDKYAT
jgi:hypothetical protein